MKILLDKYFVNEYDVFTMAKDNTPKQVLSIRVSKSVIDWLEREAQKGRTTVSRLANWYLERHARNAK